MTYSFHWSGKTLILLRCFSSNPTYSFSNTTLYLCYTVIGDVNLFTDTDGFVPEKVNRMKSLAKSMNSTEDYSRCDELLEEFHTVCDPQANSCPANNTQSFQLNIEEVHASVNAREKLVFPNITLFDGLETLVNPFWFFFIDRNKRILPTNYDCRVESN